MMALCQHCFRPVQPDDVHSAETISERVLRLLPETRPAVRFGPIAWRLPRWIPFRRPRRDIQPPETRTLENITCHRCAPVPA